jgi:tetratricopeptide (TPR) repeat protein
VARDLIGPALAAVGAEGRETLDIVKSGNIRVDMFRRLLTADLVVADLSIHNANVFYELGIRHALREHGTMMLRCAADSFPFDLQTDRYFTYDRNDPKAGLPQLIASLRAIREELEKDYTAKDSPVFASLPNLTEPDPSHFNPCRRTSAKTSRARWQTSRPATSRCSRTKYKVFEWESRGLRVLGKAQYDIDALTGAKITWEEVRKLDPEDLEANLLLGTIYQRLGDLVSSNQALDRALKNDEITQDQRAEAYSLLARNCKIRWRNDWQTQPPDERATAALRSPHLQEALANYECAFDECLNHYYSGLNALAMLKMLIALAEALPDVWAAQFPTDKKAVAELEEHQEHAEKLAAAVQLSLDSTFKRLERQDKKDVWAEISQADLACLTQSSPQRVAMAYQRALASAPEFASQSVHQQLAIYRDLGVLTGNLAEVFKVVGEPPSHQAAAIKPPRKRVLVFSGHMIDAPDRQTPRFPADKESIAREQIKQAVLKEMNIDDGVAAGYAGGASGGDILFVEVCADLGIPTRLYLAIPPQAYVINSVMKAGSDWCVASGTFTTSTQRKNRCAC